MKHLNLYETQAEYRENLSQGGGLTNLPKISFCRDNSTIKYEPKYAKKAWFTLRQYYDRFNDTYMTMPFFYSCKGIQSVKINGEPLEGFEPLSEEIVSLSFSDMLANNTWEGDVFTLSADTSGNTFYEMNSPLSAPSFITWSEDMSITFDEAINLDDYRMSTYVKQGDFFEWYESSALSDSMRGFIMVDNTITLDKNDAEFCQMLEIYAQMGVEIGMIIYHATSPYESKYMTNSLVTHGTAYIMPTEEMFANADTYPKWTDDEGIVQPVIELEIEMNSSSIPQYGFYSGMDNYSYGCLIGLSDGFFNGLDCISCKMSGGFKKGFEIKDGIATAIEYGHFNIPESVTCIMYRGLSYVQFPSVTIPDSVTSIDEMAFYGNTLLKEITIPDSVQSLGSYCCSGCTNLTSATIGNGVTIIPYGCFNRNYNLAHVNIGNEVTTIDDYAFGYCNKLETINIPDTVTTIGDGAFLDCYNLKSIHLGSSFTSLGSNAFKYCYGLQSLTISDDNPKYDSRENCNAIIETATNKMIYASNNCFIPESVTELESELFRNLDTLKEITIPQSITSLSDSLFNGCTSLSSVTLHDNIESIGNDAFTNCHNLQSINLGQKLTAINERCFKNCYTLTSITIPNTVTTIDDDAFANCSGLTSVIIPDSVTSIGQYAFSGCSGLTSVIIPDSVTSIGQYAFSNCINLTSITIGSKVSSIVDTTFRNTPKLETIIVSENNSTYDSRNNSNAIIETSSHKIIKACNNTIIPSTIKKIGWNAFSNCKELTNVNIPDGVTSIGSYAFSECDKLTSIELPSSLSDIPGYLCAGCSNLTSVIINEGPTSIGSYAFNGCKKLTSIELPNSIQKIDVGAFKACSTMSSITLGNNVTDIFDYAFKDCCKLKLIECKTLNGCDISKYGLVNVNGSKYIEIFRNIGTNGTLRVPIGSTGYDIWMLYQPHYLGYYSWTLEEVEF